MAGRLKKPRTVSEALAYSKKHPHKHHWKAFKRGFKFCTICGFPITKAAAEASSDCNHVWTLTPKGKAVCLNCNYTARGDDYKAWFKKFSKWPEIYRPKCLCCREPVMTEGTICERCKVITPTITL